MKTKILTLITFIITSLSFAQGGGFNYKALITDNGNVLATHSITFKFTVLENGSTSVYQETQSATTDANGIAVVNIGEGTVVSGNFTTIDWGNSPYFLKVEIDTGSGYQDFGTAEFKAVPYAKYAEKAGNTFSGNFGDLNNVPSGLSDGDDDTHLTDTQIAAMGYIKDANDADHDPANEIQQISKNGNTISLSNGGGSVTDSDTHLSDTDISALGYIKDANDADHDATNEIQHLSISSSQISLSNGGGTVSLPDQHDADFYKAGTTIPATSIDDDIYTNGKVGIGVANLNSGNYKLSMGGSIHMNNHDINYVNQLHFNDNLRLYDMNNDSYLAFKYGDANSGGIKFYDGNNGLLGAICSDGNNSNPSFGMRDGDGDWSVRVRKDDFTSFYINNSEKMRIMSSGNIGIGTTTPSARLEVQGTTSTPAIFAECVNGPTIQANSYNSSGVSIVAATSGGTAVLAEAVGGLDAKLCSTADNAAGYFHGNVYMMSGNVGIGTDTPNAPLEIKSDNAPSLIIGSYSPNYNERPGIQFKNNTSQFIAGDDGSNEIFGFYSKWANNRTYDAKLRVYGKASGSWGKYVEITHDGTDATIKTDTGNIILEPNGNVGIGTDTPSSLLHISAGSTGDAVLTLEADTDNAGGEGDQPRIEMNQDGGAINAMIGFDNASNNLQIRTTSNFEFYNGNAGNQQKVASLDTDGNLDLTGKITTSTSGNADMKAYIYGKVTGSNNTVVSTASSGGFYVTDGVDGYATIHFNENLGSGNYYIVIVTLNTLGRIWVTNKTSASFEVRTKNNTDDFSDEDFEFVVYKK